MDKVICKICGEPIVNGHTWKKHRIKESNYFHEYEPRFCKQSGEILPFKNRESYLESDFKGKREMIAWFKENEEEAKTYAINLLKKRKEKKDLLYAPCQVELRSLSLMPSIIWFKDTFGNYNQLCESLGMKVRFDKEDETPVFNELKDDASIVVDSREQRAWSFKNHNIIIKGLKYGDYSLEPNRFKIHIERKGLSDFASTFGVGFERFSREVRRAKKDRAYLIVLVESSLNDTIHFNYLPHMKYCKVSPDYCLHNVRDLIQSFDNLQFVFVDGRKRAVETAKKIFGLNTHVRHWDLQFLVDKKEL